MKFHDTSAQATPRYEAAASHDRGTVRSAGVPSPGRSGPLLRKAIDESPRMVAQRASIRALFGSAAVPAARSARDTPSTGAPVQRHFPDSPARGGGKAAAAPGPTAGASTNLTGMPDRLKSGIEGLSGMDMSNVRVHRNSDRPAQLNALAYAQGNEIHLGPGQEQHLPHEAWHVVQQRQGRVRETVRIAGVGVNDDAGLEGEADRMGARASTGPAQRQASSGEHDGQAQAQGRSVVQAVTIGRDYKSTDDKNYRTKLDDANYVGVLSGAAAPRPAKWIQSTGERIGSYATYKFQGTSFVNDCYEFATKLAYEIAGKTFPTSGSSFMNVVCDGKTTRVQFAVVRKPKDTDTAAADGDHGEFALNKRADPSIGQAYTTVPKSGATSASCNFHVATVVATDGQDRVTCEANAGDETRTEPVFDMYSTDSNSDYTFHGQYATEYGGLLAATGVLALP